MNIAAFSLQNPPDRGETEAIGRILLTELSVHLGLELLTFNEHYVEEGSIVLTFRSSEPLHKPLGLHLEGCLLFDVRSSGLPPAVDAEVLVFGHPLRMGLQMHRGKSYIQLTYDVATRACGEVIWHADCPEEWERVTELRQSQYCISASTYDTSS